MVAVPVNGNELFFLPPAIIIPVSNKIVTPEKRMILFIIKYFMVIKLFREGDAREIKIP